MSPPSLFEAGESLAPWHERGIPGYPYVLDNGELIGMRGNDERIYVEALRRGSDYTYKVFSGF